MFEATISLTDPDEIRTLFGARDQHVRRVRNTVGVDLVLRDDELKLRGDPDQVERGVAVIHELRSVIDREGELRTADVQRILGEFDPQPMQGTPQTADGHERIDLFGAARDVRPQTAGQSDYIRAIREHDLVFCTGPAGCGKTYLAVAMAISCLRSEDVRKIVLVRPAVEAGEKLGFLPGDLLAKVNPYLRPLLDALGDILSFEQVRQYMEHDVIEIVPLAFMRGRTLNETFIILDEGQNTTTTQMKMFLTRMGTGSRIVVTGDTTQVDLPESVSGGLPDAIERLSHVEGVAAVGLQEQDIVRHRLVGEIVRAYQRKSPPRGSRSDGEG